MSMLGLADLKSALPADTEVRIGMAVLAADGVSTAVSVSGSVIQCGFIATTTTVGNPVAVLRCGPIWLCLGDVRTQP